MTKHRAFSFFSVAGMVFIAIRNSVATVAYVVAGLVVGAVLSRALSKRRWHARPWLLFLLVLTLYPVASWLLEHSDSSAVNPFAAVCAVVVGAWAGSTPSQSSQMPFGATEFFLLLAVTGALVGGTVAPHSFLPLALVPLGIATAITLHGYMRKWR
jgi:hypothetical protein